jgi:dihydrofolate synthase / folylpolyglutamate synthase
MPKDAGLPMKNNATEFEWLLRQLPMSGIRLGTDTMLMCLELLGHPQELVPAIHVAGTNGKGSVVQLLACGLRAQGLEVGSMHSPHLVHAGERICLNGEPLSPEALNTHGLALWKRLTQFFGPYTPEHPEWPTYFEFITLLGFQTFKQHNVDVMVIETGLGGRLDATNVISQPLVTAITSIGFDHMDRLGHTLEAIALEKAGILRAGVPVVLGPDLPQQAHQAIMDYATAIHAEPVMETTAEVFHTMNPRTEAGTQRIRNMASGETIELGLLGAYQRSNLATVLGVADVLHRQGIVADMPGFIAKLRQVRWRGRFDYLPQHNLLLDGAHNEQGLHALRESVVQCFPEAGVFWCIALQAHRDIAPLVKRLRQLSEQTYGIVVTQASGQSTGGYHPPQSLRQQLRNELPELHTRPMWAGSDVPTAWWMLQRLMKSHASPKHSSPLTIATGSLYPLGEFYTMLEA